MDWMRRGILQREGWGRGGGKDARKRETKMAPNRSLTNWNHIHPRLCSQCGAYTILLEFLLNHKVLLLVKSQNTLSSSGQPPGSLPGTAFLKVTTLLLLTPQVQFACCYTSWKQHSMECAFMTVHFPVCVLSWSKVYFLKKSWLGHFPHSTNIRNCATFKDFSRLFQKRPCLQMKQSLWWWILSASVVNHRWPRSPAVGPWGAHQALWPPAPAESSGLGSVLSRPGVWEDPLLNFASGWRRWAEGSCQPSSSLPVNLEGSWAEERHAIAGWLQGIDTGSP